MPQSEINPPAHLHEREIKENLNYRVLKRKAINFTNKLQSGYSVLLDVPLHLRFRSTIHQFIHIFQHNGKKKQPAKCRRSKT